MSKGNLVKWTKDNMVALVVIPLIIGIHWGWYELQQDPYLVPQKEKKDFPIIRAYKEYTARLYGSNKSVPEK